MGNSVAGQIRIDLLANLAQFKAEMRDGSREGFGAFKDEAAKFDRWFNSRKQVTEREASNTTAWVKAMRGDADSPLRDVGGMIGGYGDYAKSLHVEMQNQIRKRDMLPWGGASTWSTLSPAEAARAAALGDPKQALAKAYAGLGQFGGMVGGPLGGFLGGIGRFALGNPLATAAIGGAAYVTKQAFDRDRLAREAGFDASMLGQSAEDVSRMKAVGLDADKLSKFQRSMAERSSGFGKLGLSAEAEAIRRPRVGSHQKKRWPLDAQKRAGRRRPLAAIS